jgi:hypothetical protein
MLSSPGQWRRMSGSATAGTESTRVWMASASETRATAAMGAVRRFRRCTNSTADGSMIEHDRT